MNILFTRFPLESRMGGAEVQTLSLMKGLQERGHEVSFLGNCPILLEESSKIQVPSTKLDIGIPPVTKWGAISFLWRKHAMKQKLIAALDAMKKPDVIVMLSLSEKLLLTDVAVRRGIRVLWVEHDSFGRWLAKNPWLPTLRKWSNFVTTVTVSELSREMYIKLGWNPEKVVTVPNGIDPLRIANGEAQIAKSDSLLHIGCVARLAEEKGIDVLLEAVRDLPQVSLTIVGDGPEESYVRDFIADIERRDFVPSNRITLHNHIEDLGEFYRSLDVFVLPSRSNDPFGLVAAEAMSCGIATIVTDACGIAGYLKNGHDALVAKADSSSALREAISTLEDAEKRQHIARHGRETAEKTFSLEYMVDEYEKLTT